MKKAFLTAAIFTITGILLAGCSVAAPSDDIADPNELPTVTIVDESEEISPDIEDIILSDSNSGSIKSDSPVIKEQRDEDSEHEKKPETDIKEQATQAPENTPKAKEEDATPMSTPKPVAETKPKMDSPSAAPKPSQPVKTETVSQPEKPVEPTPVPTVEPTPEPTTEPTPEPTPEPQPEMEIMGGGFNKAVLAAINEARALHENPAMSLDSGLCAKALEHAKEMARQGKRFHSCGGVESVSDSSSSGRTIGARSAIHASDLELNAGLSRLGVGSVRINGKQYTCVIGR